MREIKFRVWDMRTGKYMWPWPKGFHLFGEVTCFDTMGQQFDKTDDRLLRYNDLVIEQYTGLKDKNGKEIYEGDLLKVPNITRPYVVEFAKTKRRETYGHGDYGESLVIGFVFDGYYGQPEEHEVIGNRYENPELLENKE